MNVTIEPGSRCGTVRIPASKSQAHRLLILAALGEGETELICDGLSRDILATAACLNALGAEITEAADRVLRVRPVEKVPTGLCRLPCGESGSTLRFLLPVAGALGASCVFLREGRLPERPLAPLDGELAAHGMSLRSDGALLYAEGQLQSGDYTIPGDISSQYISGLLMALPLLAGESTLAVTGAVESAAYITMTEDALHLAGAAFRKEGQNYLVAGGQHYRFPAKLGVEGDWSNAAFFLCMGALSEKGVRVTGLNPGSAQGDRGVLEILRRFGAVVEEGADSILVRRGTLKGITIDAAPVPDLIPALAALAAAAEGETRVKNAVRLRLKESDRIRSTCALLRAVGAGVEELTDGLVIRGGKPLSGGTADSFGDHRIAMAAAVAASAATGPVAVLGSECTAKSYPRFWEDLASLARD